MVLMCILSINCIMNRVRDFCGHGIGREMHMLPYVLHFANDYGGKMVKSISNEERMICRSSIYN